MGGKCMRIDLCICQINGIRNAGFPPVHHAKAYYIHLSQHEQDYTAETAAASSVEKKVVI